MFYRKNKMNFEKEQKYFTEFALLNASGTCIILRPTDIDNAYKNPPQTIEELKNCHIYTICTRPRIKIDINSIIIEEKEITGFFTFLTELDNKIPFWIHKKSFFEDFKYFKRSLEKPDFIEVYSNTDELISTFPEVLLPCTFSRFGDNKYFTDLKVVYVGQAYGESGERDAITRLKSHSTLQKILSDINATDYNQEVLICLFRYSDPRYILSMDGHGNPKITGDVDLNRASTLMSTPPEEKNNITVVEASLIRFFQPKYNKIFKDSFPSTNQKMLHHCYNYDFSGIVTEIDTEDLSISLFSDYVKSSWHHIAKFDLHNETDRRKFFDMPINNYENGD